MSASPAASSDAAVVDGDAESSSDPVGLAVAAAGCSTSCPASAGGSSTSGGTETAASVPPSSDPAAAGRAAVSPALGDTAASSGGVSASTALPGRAGDSACWASAWTPAGPATVSSVGASSAAPDSGTGSSSAGASAEGSPGISPCAANSVGAVPPVPSSPAGEGGVASTSAPAGTWPSTRSRSPSACIGAAAPSRSDSMESPAASSEPSAFNGSADSVACSCACLTCCSAFRAATRTRASSLAMSYRADTPRTTNAIATAVPTAIERELRGMQLSRVTYRGDAHHGTPHRRQPGKSLPNRTLIPGSKPQRLRNFHLDSLLNRLIGGPFRAVSRTRPRTASARCVRWACVLSRPQGIGCLGDIDRFLAPEIRRVQRKAVGDPGHRLQQTCAVQAVLQP